jgi:glycosyltransferase involved in cell wall biosynthesis
MNNLPLISVAMPVYNGEEHLAEAIESVLAQSFVNFEFIIIDDGSTDRSLDVLKEYQRLDARIRLISRENRNLATTLNDIIDLAHGRWIARMDQDDIAFPDRFEKQLQWLSETSADICGSWVQFFGTRDKRILKHPQSDAAIKAELLFGCSFAHPSVMMKTELVKALRYNKEWEKCEDYDLWERAARAGWRMTNVPEVLLKYRVHNSQISTASSSRQQELTQKIRRRYWAFIFDTMGLDKIWIDEVMKLREASAVKLKMNVVDHIFMELLKQNHDEARTVIFDHVMRLYLRAAGDCPDIVKRWKAINNAFDQKVALSVIIKMSFLSLFKIRVNSLFFKRLKYLYFIIQG